MVVAQREIAGKAGFSRRRERVEKRSPDPVNGDFSPRGEAPIKEIKRLGLDFKRLVVRGFKRNACETPGGEKGSIPTDHRVGRDLGGVGDEMRE